MATNTYEQLIDAFLNLNLDLIKDVHSNKTMLTPELLKEIRENTQAIHCLLFNR